MNDRQKGGKYLLIIKNIISEPKKRNEYTIIIDENGEERRFSIHVDTFVRFTLYKGMEITREDLEKIKYEDRIRQAYNSALSYLSYRKRSEKEVRDHLREKGFSQSDIVETMGRLRKERYVDDHDFTESYIRTAIKTSDKGIERIRMELERKGIAAEIIDKKLLIYKDEWQLEKAIALVEKYVNRKKHVSIKQLQFQLKTMLQRKGYPFDIINEAVDEVFQQMDHNRDREAIQKQGSKALKKYQHLPVQERLLKIKQYLYRKGFSLDVIEDFLHRISEEDESGRWER